MGVSVRLAGPGDDAALAGLLAGHLLPGPLRLRSGPALAVQGRTAQVLLAEEDGALIGCAARSLLPLHGGDGVLPAGRLGLLHLAPAGRGRLLARGFAALRRLHQDGAAACYLTSIMADNRPALRLLTSGRAGLPVYRDLGAIRTLILAARPGGAPAADVEVRRATADDLPALRALLARTAARRSAVPAYGDDELRDGVGLLAGLGLARLRLARRGDAVVGCLGLWDQRGLRRQEVAGYAPWLAALRPAWNLLAPLHRRPRLPPPGAILAAGFAALPLIDGDDPTVFAVLLDAVLADADAAGLAQVAVALHADDPAQAALARRPGFRLASRLFAVHWPDGAAAAAALAARTPYVEGGAL